MTSDRIILRAMLVLVLIIAAGEIYLFDVAHRLQMSVTSGVGAAALGTTIQPSAQDNALNSIEVGDNPVAYQGTITVLQSGSMQVKTQDGTVSFAISAGTKLYTTGAQKSAIEFQKEMTAYNAQVTQLMQDPTKNAAALKALKLPTAFVQTPLALSDFAVGDSVDVKPSVQNSDGSYAATAVALANAAAPATSQ